MSMNSTSMNPNWDQPPPVPRQGMSGGSKVLIGLGCGCGLLVLLCCGGLGGGVYFFQDWFKQSFSTDPVAVREETARMADIDLPKGLNPAGVFRPKDLPFLPQTRQVVPTFVIYADTSNESSLFLVNAAAGMAQTPDEVKRQAEAFRGKQGKAEEIQAAQTSSKEIKIGGKPVTFQFVQGTDKESGKKRITVTGTFQGRNGPVVLFFSGDPKKFDEATLTRMLESIQTAEKPSLDRPAEKPDPDQPAVDRPSEKPVVE